jgi:Family of unknown function (DUF6165)
MSAYVQIAFGELIDKITILEIKSARVTDAQKLTFIRHELALLLAVWKPLEAAHPAVSATRAELKTINETLWDIEDEIRAKESAQCFDEEFVRLARAVYQTNDQRFALKSRINLLLGSGVVEQKQYAQY